MKQEAPLCYCLRMRNASQAVAEFYNHILASSGVTARQYFLLIQIGQMDLCSVQQLAAAVELDRSTLSRSLKPLKEQGMIADRKAEGARSSRLELTEKGKTVLAKAERLWQKAQRSLEEQIGPQGVEALEKIFAALSGLKAGQ